MRLLYKEGKDSLVAKEINKVYASRTCLICYPTLKEDMLLEVELPSYESVWVVMEQLVREGYFDARNYPVKRRHKGLL